MFRINKNCEGCGFCSACCRDAIELKFQDGNLCAKVKDGMESSLENVSFICPQEIKPKLNKVQNKYVAFHKQIERRMDGSAGGVFGALLETVAKEGFYFTGTVYDTNMAVHHVVTNDPEKIVDFSGYKPIQSNTTEVYVQIKQLLERGEKVLFCGTPLQCYALKLFVGSTQGLILVDIIETDPVQFDIWQEYLSKLEEKFGSKITNVRMYDKEFSYRNSKRIECENARTYFIRKEDAIDRALKDNRFTVKKNSNAVLGKLNERIGDLTIGSYFYNRDGGLGATYVSVNSELGVTLFEKCKRRIDVLIEGSDVNQDCIDIPHIQNSCNNKTSYITGKGLNNFFERQSVLFNERTLRNNLLLSLKMFIETTRLRPVPIFKFIRYNFFHKGIITDFRNNGFLFITPYSTIKMGKGAKIELHGPLTIGEKRVKSSKLETRLWMQPNSKIIVHENGKFGYGSNIEVYTGGVLDIGELFSNSGITIICGKNIKIGSPVNIAKGCTVRDTNGHLVAIMGYKKDRSVEIGNHCWICSDSTLMPGVKIGDGAIVGACSYVVRNVAPFNLVQGNPINVVAYPKYFRM